MLLQCPTKKRWERNFILGGFKNEFAVDGFGPWLQENIDRADISITSVRSRKVTFTKTILFLHTDWSEGAQIPAFINQTLAMFARPRSPEVARRINAVKKNAKDKQMSFAETP